jgi:hypothetical protein
MKMTDVEIYDGKGRLRALDDGELASLSDEAREAYFALAVADEEAVAAIDERSAATAEHHSNVRAMNAAQAAHHKANPPPDRIDEARKVIRAQQRAAGIPVKEPKSKSKKVSVETLKVYDEAVAAAESSRKRMLTSEMKVKETAKVRADAIMAWQRANPPKSSLQTYRDHLARTAQHEAAGKLTVETKEEIIPSHLDSVLRSGKGGHNINRSHKRPNFRRV